MEEKNNIYKKFQSFENFKNINQLNTDEIEQKIFNIYKEFKMKLPKTFNEKDKILLEKIITDLKSKNKNENAFSLKPNSIAEINTFKNLDTLKYLISRYKYEIYPKTKELDIYPPLIQIEPSSICNFRCVFCFETDKTFTNKKNGFMGTMNFELYKKIVDEIEGKVQFVTLASRGEPLVAKSFSKMLEYASEKFLVLKINTNASLLNQDKCHAILSSGVKTVVFSADAADEKLYSKLRVNGDLKKTLQNIKMFKNIKDTNYKNSKIITRVSGVKFNDEQKFSEMENLWGELVDQVAFVDYNPWENCYEKEKNNIKEACSDLWRRMFIWWDGKINPCDVDYKSHLSPGKYPEISIKNSWNSDLYNKLRKAHLNKNREGLIPCKACSVI